jgi:hypothetical protein
MLVMMSDGQAARRAAHDLGEVRMELAEMVDHQLGCAPPPGANGTMTLIGLVG